MAGRQMNYKRCNAQDAWELVNKDNKKLVKEFMEYLTATDRSSETKEKYFHNLQMFFQWVKDEKENKFFAEMTKRDYMGWIAHMQDDGLSPSRVKVMRSTVSSLSNFCELILADEDERFENYRNLIIKIKLSSSEMVREKTFLSMEQINELLEKLEEIEDYRGCLYIVLSYYTACRKAEIVQFKRSDFAEDRLQDGYYRTAMIRCKGKGKLGKVRQFYVPQEKVQYYLDKYLATRTDDMDDLFIVATGNPATGESCNIWCKKYTRILGVPVYPHSFRASMATNSRDQGKDVGRIQKLLGHNSADTTNLYLRKTDDEDIKGLY